MRRVTAAFLLLLACACACAEPPAPPRVAPVPPKAPSKAVRAPRSTLERSFTGQTRPTVLITNGLSRAQHLFVDAVYHAELAPASSVAVELTVGDHLILCSDSRDVSDATVSTTENFQRGFAYRFAVVP